MTLVAIAPPDYQVAIDLRYATPANFTGKPVYARAEAFLHVDAARHLARAIELAAAGERRTDFLADPRRGSPHSRGVAIDLTLVDAASGAELDMGTEFDAFTELSYHGSTEVGVAAQRNRHMLLGLMSAAGWDFYRREWWHYQLFESRRYPVLSDSVLAPGLMGAA
jgi:D-alanyl-D-alanine dipeptidase